MTRRFSLAICVVLIAQAIVVGVILSLHVGTVFPVSAYFLDRDWARVNLGVGAVILLVFTAVLRLVAALGRDLHWLEYSQVSAIIVFLVAQLNGIRDISALVPLYALTAAGTLFLVLHARSRERASYVFGAMVAIVPWGVIAFYQVGSTLVGPGPAVVVRVITLAMLALGVAVWFAAYRGSARQVVVLTALTASTFAWMVVAEELMTTTPAPL